MNTDKIEGFLIGVGAGVLLAAYMQLRESLASRREMQEDSAGPTVWDHAWPATVPPAETAARAAPAATA